MVADCVPNCVWPTDAHLEHLGVHLEAEADVDALGARAAVAAGLLAQDVQ